MSEIPENHQDEVTALISDRETLDREVGGEISKYLDSLSDEVLAGETNRLSVDELQIYSSPDAVRGMTDSIEKSIQSLVAEGDVDKKLLKKYMLSAQFTREEAEYWADKLMPAETIAPEAPELSERQKTELLTLADKLKADFGDDYTKWISEKHPKFGKIDDYLMAQLKSGKTTEKIYNTIASELGLDTTTVDGDPAVVENEGEESYGLNQKQSERLSQFEESYKNESDEIKKMDWIRLIAQDDSDIPTTDIVDSLGGIKYKGNLLGPSEALYSKIGGKDIIKDWVEALKVDSTITNGEQVISKLSEVFNQKLAVVAREYGEVIPAPGAQEPERRAFTERLNTAVDRDIADMKRELGRLLTMYKATPTTENIGAIKETVQGNIESGLLDPEDVVRIFNIADIPVNTQADILGGHMPAPQVPESKEQESGGSIDLGQVSGFSFTRSEIYESTDLIELAAGRLGTALVTEYEAWLDENRAKDQKTKNEAKQNKTKTGPNVIVLDDFLGGIMGGEAALPFPPQLSALLNASQVKVLQNLDTSDLKTKASDMIENAALEYFDKNSENLETQMMGNTRLEVKDEYKSYTKKQLNDEIESHGGMDSPSSEVAALKQALLYRRAMEDGIPKWAYSFRGGEYAEDFSQYLIDTKAAVPTYSDDPALDPASPGFDPNRVDVTEIWDDWFDGVKRKEELQKGDGAEFERAIHALLEFLEGLGISLGDEAGTDKSAKDLFLEGNGLSESEEQKKVREDSAAEKKEKNDRIVRAKEIAEKGDWAGFVLNEVDYEKTVVPVPGTGPVQAPTPVPGTTPGVTPPPAFTEPAPVSPEAAETAQKALQTKRQTFLTSNFGTIEAMNEFQSQILGQEKVRTNIDPTTSLETITTLLKETNKISSQEKDGKTVMIFTVGEGATAKSYEIEGKITDQTVEALKDEMKLDVEAQKREVEEALLLEISGNLSEFSDKFEGDLNSKVIKENGLSNDDGTLNPVFEKLLKIEDSFWKGGGLSEPDIKGLGHMISTKKITDVVVEKTDDTKEFVGVNLMKGAISNPVTTLEALKTKMSNVSRFLAEEELKFNNKVEASITKLDTDGWIRKDEIGVDTLKDAKLLTAEGDLVKGFKDLTSVSNKSSFVFNQPSLNKLGEAIIAEKFTIVRWEDKKIVATIKGKTEQQSLTPEDFMKNINT